MKNAIALSFALLMAASPAAAQVDVAVDGQALTAVRTVVVLPLGCGADAQCLALENELTAAVRQHLGVEIVPRKTVESAVERMGLNNPQGHLAHLLAQEVGADAYLRIQGSERPGGSGTGSRGVSAYPTGIRNPGVAFRKQLLGKISAAYLEMRTAEGETEVITGRSKGRRGFVSHVERMLKEASR